MESKPKFIGPCEKRQTGLRLLKGYCARFRRSGFQAGSGGDGKFLWAGGGLRGVGQPAAGVIELAAPDGKDEEGVPGAGIAEVGFGEIGGAVGVGVVDSDELKAASAGEAGGGKQVLGAQFVAGFLRTGGDVREREGQGDPLDVVVFCAQQGAAALHGVLGARVGEYGGPGFGVDAKHIAETIVPALRLGRR